MSSNKKNYLHNSTNSFITTYNNNNSSSKNKEKLLITKKNLSSIQHNNNNINNNNFHSNNNTNNNNQTKLTAKILNEKTNNITINTNSNINNVNNNVIQTPSFSACNNIDTINKKITNNNTNNKNNTHSTNSYLENNSNSNKTVINTSNNTTNKANILSSSISNSNSTILSNTLNNCNKINNLNNNPAGNVKVICRFRPVSDKEKEHTKNVCAEFIDDYQVAVKSSHDLNTYRFSFDKILNPSSSQQEIFDLAGKPIIDSVLEGFNGTIFAYGQTSSGKTYTMMGDLSNLNNNNNNNITLNINSVRKNNVVNINNNNITNNNNLIDSNSNEGIIPRMVNYIFNYISNASSENEYIVKVSMMEIYMEKIRDLVETERVNLYIREDKNKGNFVEDLSEHYVSSEEEIMELVKIGANNRTTGFTYMNDYSSRSHTILMIMIKSTNIHDLTTKTGKLFLVDLAGSEKIAKTGATGLTLEEARNINKSLTTLGMVINSLTDEKSTHVPYRESKVTRILQESLGGNAKTCLIITCSPSSHNDTETLSTLRFGTRAKKIENRPKINKEISAAELKLEVDRLENLLNEANLRINYLEKMLVNNKIAVPSRSEHNKNNSLNSYNKGVSPKKIGRSSNSIHFNNNNNNNISKSAEDKSNTIKDNNSDNLINSKKIANRNSNINNYKDKDINKDKDFNTDLLNHNKSKEIKFELKSNLQYKNYNSNNNNRYDSINNYNNNNNALDNIHKDSVSNNFNNNKDSPNKLSNIILENRNLVEKIKDLENTLNMSRIQIEENYKLMASLFELKFTNEEALKENANKIEFLERKIKKIKQESLTVDTSSMLNISNNNRSSIITVNNNNNINVSDIYNNNRKDIINSKLEDIVSYISDSNPCFEYNKKHFVKDAQSLINKYINKSRSNNIKNSENLIVTVNDKEELNADLINDNNNNNNNNTTYTNNLSSINNNNNNNNTKEDSCINSISFPEYIYNSFNLKLNKLSSVLKNEDIVVLISLLESILNLINNNYKFVKKCNKGNSFVNSSNNNTEANKVLVNEILNEFNNYQKDIKAKNFDLESKLNQNEINLSNLNSILFDYKTQIDFYQSSLSQDYKNYIKKIECLESSLNMVNKLYHQIFTQNSVLRIENEVLQNIVSKKNEYILKIDKEIIEDFACNDNINNINTGDISKNDLNNNNNNINEYNSDKEDVSL